MIFLKDLIIIVIFYFVLLILDTMVFHNKISDIQKVFKDNVFKFLFVFSIVLSIIYYFFFHNLLTAILFLMYTTFIEKLISRKE